MKPSMRPIMVLTGMMMAIGLGACQPETTANGEASGEAAETTDAADAAAFKDATHPCGADYPPRTPPPAS